MEITTREIKSNGWVYSHLPGEDWYTVEEVKQ